MQRNLILLITLFIMAVASAKASDKVIYGQDNRMDTYAVQNNLYVHLAKSTAAMVPVQNLAEIEEGILLGGSALEDRGMCSTERFAKQLTSAVCSGFLVDTNKLVTAGHCIKSMADCNSYRWVFDYKVEEANQPWAMVPKTSVYKCTRIISRALSGSGSYMNDYAYVELEREVIDREPLDYRKEGRLQVGDPLVVIGHPTGLPQKIADGAYVRRLQSKFFLANLDTYGGNSGSAVFNSETGLLEGILVRGATDYVYNSSRRCYQSNRVSDSYGEGEGVTYITNIPGL